MKKTSIFASVFITFALTSSIGTCQAGNAEEACDVMMGKLANQYEIDTVSYRASKQKYSKPNVARTANTIVTMAFGLREDDLEEQWPGLWKFSTKTFINATKELPTPKIFKERAYASCVSEFG